MSFDPATFNSFRARSLALGLPSISASFARSHNPDVAYSFALKLPDSSGWEIFEKIGTVLKTWCGKSKQRGGRLASTVVEGSVPFFGGAIWLEVSMARNENI